MNCRVFLVLACCLLAMLLNGGRLAASGIESLPDSREAEAARNRTTLFGVPLDPNSEYGLAWFPETLRASEMDLEFSEAHLDWFHAEGKAHRQDEIKAEIEKSFNSLTLEFELPYLIDR